MVKIVNFMLCEFYNNTNKKRGKKGKRRKKEEPAIQGSLECSPLPSPLLTTTLSPVYWPSKPGAPLQRKDLSGLGLGLCKIGIDGSALDWGLEAWLPAPVQPIPPWVVSPGPVYLASH